MVFFSIAQEHCVPNMDESAVYKSTGEWVKAMNGQCSARPIGPEFLGDEHTWERFLQWGSFAEGSQPSYSSSSGNGPHIDKETSYTVL